MKRWLKRWSAIGLVIGNVKSENGIARNRQEGIKGDKNNELSSGCGLILLNGWQFFLLPIKCWQKIRQFLK
jgi:hypothetical protein